jgi:hypothetical protein
MEELAGAAGFDSLPLNHSNQWTGREARALDLLIECAVCTGRDTCFGSALEGNKAAESRIREAVLSGFDVTRKPVFESRVSGNFDDEVVPTMELIQRQLVFLSTPQKRLSVEI